MIRNVMNRNIWKLNNKNLINVTNNLRVNISVNLYNNYHTNMMKRSDVLVQHKPSDENRPDAKWEFNKESQKEIEKVLKKYPSSYKRSAVIPLLYLAQEQNDNWIPLAAMNKIAEILDIPQIRVYEVATFYTMFNREPLGKYHLQVCGTTPCQLCGSESIIETIEKHLDIKNGETTKDKMFTLTEVECLGACVNAPMLQINNHEFYENLTPATTIQLLDDLRAGKTVTVGPQNGQKDCEGPTGQTTLKDVDSLKAPCRDFTKLKADYEAALKKEQEAKK